MTAYHLAARGCFKPYVRMTQKGKFVDPQAQQYLASKDNLAWQFSVSLLDRAMIQRGQRLSVDIRIWHDHGFNHRDLDNEAKAVLDAAQGIVFEDDRWVDEIHAERQRGDCCLVQLYVRVL